MEALDLFGYAGSILIGISLGLIGGGGSILTVPVLVYLFRIDAVLATAYSLFIVGLSALEGSGTYYRQGLVSIRTALVFGAPALVAVFVTRYLIVPAIPDRLFSIASIEVTKSLLLLVLFAVLMILASISMIRGRKDHGIDKTQEQAFNYPLILLEGTIVGVLTGLVGAGGGFLIIPALVVLSKLPMKKAVGTSLLIIAVKSLVGFTGDIANYTIDWALLLTVSALAISGIFIGTWLSKRIDGQKLKVGFGWFVLVMGAYILVRELAAA